MAAYELAPEAVEDLVKIQSFISMDSPAAAERLIDQFFAAFDRLAEWPRSGHTRADLTSKPVLFWPIDSYLIVYRQDVAADMIQIVAVLHAARDLAAILEDR